ncbi:MAG: DUF3048 domain-containing protein [Lachnospiraceae bacterium]|nr:DUF3048 domain-containing protein [Lachnospiraceae bacterium]
MKKMSLLATCLLVACVVTGCAAPGTEEPVIQVVESQPINTPDAVTPAPEVTEAPAVEATAEPETTEEPEQDRVADTKTIKERYVDENGQMQSYLTGEWIDADVAQRRPMAVMLGNNKAILPQYGVSKAGIIYEAPVEGRISRMMAIIEDYDDLEFVGPVRSSRDYFVYEAMAYDAIYCNWGLAVPYVEELLASDRVDNISQALLGIHNPYSDAFFRRDRPGYKTEYTGYMSIDGYQDGVAHYDYETEYRDSFEQAFTFANDGWPALYEDHEDATLIYPGGSSGTNRSGYGSHRPSFEYNAEDGLYYRYQFDKEHIDEYNGEQIAVANVVFKVCDGAARDANDYLIFGVHGSGDAYIFTGGKVIEGTWEHETDSSANMFYDENGKEVIFNQGKTWICCIWKDYADCMEWK